MLLINRRLDGIILIINVAALEQDHSGVQFWQTPPFFPGTTRRTRPTWAAGHPRNSGKQRNHTQVSLSVISTYREKLTYFGFICLWCIWWMKHTAEQLHPHSTVWCCFIFPGVKDDVVHYVQFKNPNYKISPFSPFSICSSSLLPNPPLTLPSLPEDIKSTHTDTHILKYFSRVYLVGRRRGVSGLIHLKASYSCWWWNSCKAAIPAGASFSASNYPATYTHTYVCASDYPATYT